jgi:oxygen-independent coproporphyrinogen III oxidase
MRKHELNEKIETIYFGGGTPSILEPSEITTILDTIYLNFSLNDMVEITLETNPEMMTISKLEAFKEIGVNRLSIGIQSFDAEELKWMERTHTAEEAQTCVTNAKKAGFDNVSIDLIYGLPNQTMHDWKMQLDKAISLDVQHISSYCLTVEKGTKLGNLVSKQKIIPLDNDLQAEMLEELEQTLAIAGFEQYEISNFSKIGHRSKHNTAYWENKIYLGVGPSAHSYMGKTRSWNVANNQIYIRKIEANEFAAQEIETLRLKDRANEMIMTRMRMSDGLLLTDLEKVIPLSDEQKSLIEVYIAHQWITVSHEILKLTSKGKCLADKLSSDLFY